MLTPDQITKYHADSNYRAGYCANCNKTLHSLEIYMCEHCCAELMSDPNSTMWEEDDDN
jgi:predicted amidophosphoribosyltransferase